MNDPELDRKINQQLTILNNNLDILNNGNKAKLQSYGQDECSQIIDNFKKKLLMKPGTNLMRIVNKDLLQHNDVIIYQPTENSHYIFGFYKRDSKKFENKHIFKFLNEEDFQLKEQPNFPSGVFSNSIVALYNPNDYEKPTSMISDTEVIDDPKGELMLIEINETCLNHLKLSYTSENDRGNYTPIIIKLNDTEENSFSYFRIGKYFGAGQVDPMLPRFTTPKTKHEGYYTFINEKEYNENVLRYEEPCKRVFNIN